MKRTITTITLEPEVKKRALKLFESRGMKLSAVVELYLKKLLIEGRENATNSKPRK